MKNVGNKIVTVSHDVIKFIVAVCVLAVYAGIFVIALTLVPIMGLATTVTEGGSLFDNTCDAFKTLMKEIGWNIE